MLAKINNSRVYLVAVFAFIIDFISKLVISNLLIENQSIKVINNFFYITYAKNTGVAFSMLEGNVLFIVVMTVMIMFFLIKYINSKKFNVFESVTYGMIIGGAVGNLFDRLVHGYVIDFFDFYIFGYDAPIFNIADIFIVIGILLVLVSSFKEEIGVKNEVSCRKKREN